MLFILSIKFQIELLRINKNCVAWWVEIISEGTLEYFVQTHTTLDEKEPYGCLSFLNNKQPKVSNAY